MTDHEKSAYRYLLYDFLLSIRTTPTDNHADVWTVEQLKSYSNYTGAVAYLLHNLALAATNDFAGFNEQHFWQSVDAFNSNYPNIAINHLRQVFDDQLAGSQQG
ncbi:hypothetical protein F0P96_07075 [Hymenobacter busanensis]|uniref:Uncharacterized protein n=1 Tax=Hymenobacter busanensis TaxID=2607656 RepID=A0A7L5A138_9BACT|nr:hypothetical protein [Hymenobacter busanensis]KAA9338584.1 hypothetical protein F0P96_07075 [Hymenobacter busanensis]QHJ08987.1 hypothetical protein GUY19_17525 [Hymenobacter busanensis]